MIDLAKTLNNDPEMIKQAQIFVQQPRNSVSYSLRLHLLMFRFLKLIFLAQLSPNPILSNCAEEL